MADFKEKQSIKFVLDGEDFPGMIVEIVPQRARPESKVPNSETIPNKPGKSYVVKKMTGRKGRPQLFWVDAASVVAL